MEPRQLARPFGATAIDANYRDRVMADIRTASLAMPEDVKQDEPGDSRSDERATEDEQLPITVDIERVCEALADAAATHGLPIGFFARLIWQESKFDQWARSPVGALGVAQFMPPTAAEYGLQDPFDPIQAVAASARFLRQLRDQFGNLGLAAAAYNAGGGRIRKWLNGQASMPRGNAELRAHDHRSSAAALDGAKADCRQRRAAAAGAVRRGRRACRAAPAPPSIRCG